MLSNEQKLVIMPKQVGTNWLETKNLKWELGNVSSKGIVLSFVMSLVSTLQSKVIFILSFILPLSTTQFKFSLVYLFYFLLNQWTYC